MFCQKSVKNLAGLSIHLGTCKARSALADSQASAHDSQEVCDDTAHASQELCATSELPVTPVSTNQPLEDQQQNVSF